MRAVLKKTSWGTRRVFGSIRCKKQASTVRKRYSVPKTAFCGTRRIFKGPQNSRLHRPWTASWGTRRVFGGVPCQKQHLPHRTHLQCAKRPPLSLFAPATPSLAPSTALGTRNAHRSEVIRLKRGCIPWKSLRIHPPILILKIVSHRCHHAHFLDIRSVAVAIFYRENSLARSLDFAEAATGVTREFLSYFTSVSCSFLHH